MSENYLKRIFQESFRKEAIKYGFIEQHLPFSADYEAYTSICPDNKDDLIKIVNTDGKIRCLRMDQTVMAVLSEEEKAVGKGIAKRIFYLDEVYMLGKSRGAMTEVSQYGLEIFHESEVAADAETIAAAFAILKDVGLQKSDFKIEINNVRFPREVVRSAMPEDRRSDTALVNRVLHLVEEKNKPAIKNLGEGFDTDMLVALVDAFGPIGEAIEAMTRFNLSQGALAAITELISLKNMLEMYGIRNLEADLGSTNRYHYYDSYMCRIYSMQTGKTIAAGGRYDYLGSSDMKGCGLSFYEDSLMELLELKNSFESYGYELDFALLAGREHMSESVRIANALREKGIRTVMVNYEGKLEEDSIPQFVKKARKIGMANSSGIAIIDQMKKKKYVTTSAKLLSGEVVE